jgi:methylenetetrahydrofolate reductase (NADPH)
MNTFRNAIRNKDFVVTSECFLKPETDGESVRIQAEVLRDAVDGVIVTDNQHGRLHMSSLAAASLMLQNGIDPIMQLTCRNRNRIALLADLFGAAALGVGSVLLVRGNRVPEGMNPRPKAVFDTTAAELIAMAASMKDDESLPSPPEFLIGGLVTPHSPQADWIPRKLIEKTDAGAGFMLTYPCMDMALLRGYMKHLVNNKLTHRFSFIVTTAILTSADDAKWLRDGRPNAIMPDTIVNRIESAADPVREGFDICVEQIRELQEIPGISGVNIMATTDLGQIPRVVSEAGL